MWYLIGLSALLFVLFLYGQYHKQKKYASQKNDVDGVLLALIKDNKEINITANDQITYFGSIVYDEDVYTELKSLFPMTNKELTRYFSSVPYNSETDNLLIFKINKKDNPVYFIAAVLDPHSMDREFSLYEILGPFTK